MYSFLRIFKAAFQDMGRNPGLSAMTVFILTLMLLSVNTLWSMDVTTKEAVRLVKNQVNVSLYLTADVDEKKTTEIKSLVNAFPEVTNVEVLTRDNVLAAFKTRHKGSTEILDALTELGSNPFGPILIVHTKEPGDYRAVLAAVSGPAFDKYIEGKSFEGHEEALDKIQSITNRIERIGLGLSVLFAVIAFLIIFNTIRVAIQTQRIEISIKRLVGASNWFIRGPYLVQAALFTIFSVGLTAALLYFGLGWLDHYLSVVLPSSFSLLAYYQNHFATIFGIQTASVLLLTVISSVLAMRKQLKV